MSAGAPKAKLKAADLEAGIMKRLAAKPQCDGITYVYVKATKAKLPEDTWAHTLISWRPDSLRTPDELKALHAVLNEMRKEFDFISD